VLKDWDRIFAMRPAFRFSGGFTNDLLVTETVKALCRVNWRADSMIAAAKALTCWLDL